MLTTSYFSNIHYLPTYIHYIHTYIHTHIHTYIHTYIHTKIPWIQFVKMTAECGISHKPTKYTACKVSNSYSVL
jgi:hypothetical protein